MGRLRIDSEQMRLLGDWAPGTADVSNLPFTDSFVVNVEGPILGSGATGLSARPKAGPALFHRVAPTKEGGAIAVLANNHMMDFGQHGLTRSMEALSANGLLAVGAGPDQEEAESPLIFEWCSLRVGIIARCETQFGVARGDGPGVAALSHELFQQVRVLSQEVDLVIVSIHAAAETVPWPSPERQCLFRALVDAGADIVHGHHAHVPQGWERYGSAWIFYGLGNFCVDPSDWAALKNALWSVAPVLKQSDSGVDVSIETLVIEERSERISIRSSTAEERRLHEEYLEKCNAPLSNPELLAGVWQEASLRLYDRYFATWLGFKSTPLQLFKSLLKRFLYRPTEILSALRKQHLAVKGDRDQMLLRYHFFACESHRDTVATATGLLSGELQDFRSQQSTDLVNALMTDA